MAWTPKVQGMDFRLQNLEAHAVRTDQRFSTLDSKIESLDSKDSRIDSLESKMTTEFSKVHTSLRIIREQVADHSERITVLESGPRPTA